MHRLARFGVALLLLLIGFYLGADALTFALQPADVAAGRARGCYTLLDFAFGRKTPSDALRNLESAVALALLVGSCLVALRVPRRWWRASSPPSV